MRRAWRMLAVSVLLLAGPVACGRGGRDTRRHALPETSERSVEDGLIAAALSDSAAGSRTLQLGVDTLHVGPSARTFYRSRGFRAAWTDGKGLTDAGKGVMAQLGRSSDDGLAPERYHCGSARRLASLISSADGDSARAVAAADLDLVLSEGMARYTDDLAGGTIDPKDLGLEWHLAEEHAPKVQALRKLAAGADPGSLVSSLRPHTGGYARMMSALAAYRSIVARGGWPRVTAPAGGGTVAASPAAHPETDSSVASAAGSPAVASIRRRLVAGEDSVEAALAGAGRRTPGVMDHNLEQAVRHFQERLGLTADGKVGPETVAALNVPARERLRTLELNMDRWRWLPRDPGSFYVLVNVAGMNVRVVRGDSTVMQQKVIVGKPGWTTPVFADRMVGLVVNPYWNVPASIVAEELEPEMAKDPNYLASHRFEATPAGGYRQLPGPKNALGRYKFQLTNDQDIYLHDTPAKSAFGKDDRDLSHGCIRLQDARAMADLIGGHEGIAESTIQQDLASDRNHVLDFHDPVPTYIMYFTAAVEPDGTIRFYPDVYGIDRRLSALAPALEGRPVDPARVTRDSAAVRDSIRRVKAAHAGGSTA